jgi:hypothetical protein
MPLSRIQLLATVGSVLLITLLLELIRRNYLKERYSLLWFVTGGVFLVLSLIINSLSPIARILGFQVVSNALLFAGMLFLVIIALGMTISISRLSERNKRLTQEMALLKKKIEGLEKGQGDANRKK